MRLAELEDMSRTIAATASRSAKIERLARLLAALAPDEVETAVAWLSGGLRQGRIGLGPAALHAVDVPPATQPSLTLNDVDAAFSAIATQSGAGSSTRRTALLRELLARATEPEHRFLVRLITGELRQGALAGVMEEAVAAASRLPVDAIRRAAMFGGELAPVAHAALTGGAAGLAHFRLELFRPVQPMLAQPAADLDEALTRHGTLALEYKLDGARVQVHKAGDVVRVFTRGLNEVTTAVPELVERVRTLPARTLVLDGEVLALKPDGTPHPFQVTMRRFGRRLDVERTRAELPLTPFFFDVLHVDGEDLFTVPAERRAGVLRAHAAGLEVPRLVTADAAEADAFLSQALARGHEGLMAKATDAPYEAGRRGSGWLKIKPAHTLDLVVLAVERGNGRRSGWLSNIHLGARDPATGAFVMLGKTFKGMTDAMLEWQTKRFRELQVADDGYVVHVRPEQVVEVAFNDVQESPQYPAGMALRFARVVRYRDDKSAADADTVETVRAILEGRTAKGFRPH